ncbi:hypothetical protein [Microbacterium aurantiacum]|uniref:hypothetical protein n=1 Tax=Microbacterium aurantiacum TaxID=162393 RepID=UPI000C800FC2|nr:hypothetical protein [Microbacterium aurantiacum]
MSHPYPVGGHELPPQISGSATPPPVAPRKKHTGAILASLAALAAVVTIAGVQLSAHTGYDSAQEAYRDSVSAAAVSAEELRAEVGTLRATTDAAALILENNSGTLLDATSSESLGSAVSEGQATASAAEDALSVSLPETGQKPFWFWELFGETQHLDEHRERADEHAENLEDLGDDAGTVATSVNDSGVTALASAASSASTLEAAHVSARNLDVIALRDAAEDVSSTTSIDAYAADAFIALESAAMQVVASAQAEIAEKAGPLQGTRLEVEAFARSLAPGVLLEFDWSQIVNGFGLDGGMGGYTTWWYDDPGYATIELSDSVAEQWPSAMSQALVAHEVGHAISVKCADMYDDSTQDSIEKWATGWAISMGFTDDANGVWAYGYPPQSYIDAAAGCR